MFIGMDIFLIYDMLSALIADGKSLNEKERKKKERIIGEK